MWLVSIIIITGISSSLATFSMICLTGHASASTKIFIEISFLRNSRLMKLLRNLIRKIKTPSELRSYTTRNPWNQQADSLNL